MQIADKGEGDTGRMDKLADRKQKIAGKNLDKEPDKKTKI